MCTYSETTKNPQCLNTQLGSSSTPNTVITKNHHLYQQTHLNYNTFSATHNFPGSANVDDNLDGVIAQTTNLEDHLYQQTPLNCNTFSTTYNFPGSANVDDNLDRVIAQTTNLEEQGLKTCWDHDLERFIGGDFLEYANILLGVNTNTSPTRYSCFPGKEIIQSDKQRVSLNKRASDKSLNLKEDNEDGDKKLKLQREIKNSKEQNNSVRRQITTDYNKETSDIAEEKFKTSVRVRARRGQAADKHSLAERVRRQIVGDKMKELENLVPCKKGRSKGEIIDEIINYIKYLQYQVEYLSMKLAVLSTNPDFYDEINYTKEVIPASGSDIHHNVETLPEICLPQNDDEHVLQQYFQTCSTLDDDFQSMTDFELQQAILDLPCLLTTDFPVEGNVGPEM